VVSSAAVVSTAAAAATTAPREAELQEVRREIARLENELRTAREQTRTLAERVRASGIELALHEDRVREARLALDLQSAGVERGERAVRDAEMRLHRLRDSLRVHLVALYSLGRERMLRLLLAMAPRSDTPRAIRQLRFLARRDAVALAEYRATERRLAQQRAALAVERERLLAWVGQEEERRVAVAAVRDRHQQLLGEADRRRGQLESRAASLRQREQRLDRMLGILLAEDGSVLEQTDVRQFRGALDWPIEGEVVTEFGPRLDRRYGTEVPHNGVAIAPAPGAREVRTIYPGRVLFAAPFQGFGLTVVVQHAGAVLSLYAGLSDLRVAKGDVVSLGHVLGSSSGELYFELREDNRAVDPLKWLR
jgi:septal ring factor EnvC (AmiA/AmiB activator)